MEFKPPPLIVEAGAFYRQPLPPFPVVALTLEVSIKVQLTMGFGFDATGVHALIADGFEGAKSAENWGRLFALYLSVKGRGGLPQYELMLYPIQAESSRTGSTLSIAPLGRPTSLPLTPQRYVMFCGGFALV